jgi:processing peptidase subunit alpha
MVIVATGIEHSNLLKRMEPLFADASLQGKFREVKAQEPLPAFPATSQDNAYTATPSLIRNLSPGNARFMLGLQGAGANSPEEFAALEVFREIVGGGAVKAKDSSNRASLLARNVLEKNENALQVHAFHNGYSDAGLFGVVAEAAPGQGGAVLEAVRAELEAASKNFTAEDLSRAKNILKVKAADAFSNTQGLAGFIADSYLSFGGSGNLTEYFELIDSVTEAKVKAAAKKTVSSAPVVAAEGDVRGLRL